MLSPSTTSLGRGAMGAVSFPGAVAVGVAGPAEVGVEVGGAAGRSAPGRSGPGAAPPTPPPTPSGGAPHAGASAAATARTAVTYRRRSDFLIPRTQVGMAYRTL